MTRCKNCYYNSRLKSSVYNPSNQRYESQLTAYNAMRNHLRKVLLAKSVVDCGKDEKISKKNVKYKNTGTKSARRVKGSSVSVSASSSSQNIIDRLAYDTKHHPHIAANISRGLNFKDHRPAQFDSAKKSMKRSSSAESSDMANKLREFRSSSAKSYKGELRDGSSALNVDIKSPHQPRRRGLQRVAGSASGPETKDNRDFEEAENEPESTRDIKEGRKFLDEPEGRINVKIFGTVTPCVASNSEFFFRSNTSNVSCDLLLANSQLNINENNDDGSMYVKFVYEITKEIMDKGYYYDEDIERVFEKHFKRNLRTLNKERMLEEINRLKKSLNINYDSDNDEDDCAKFPIDGSSNGLSKDRKNLSTNILPEKGEEKSSIDNDDEDILQDNSTEIIISREELLRALLSVNLNPEEAGEIVKSLENRSKELRSVLEEKKMINDYESRIDSLKHDSGKRDSSSSLNANMSKGNMNTKERKINKEITNDVKLEAVSESSIKNSDYVEKEDEESEEREKISNDCLELIIND